ncbi:MAG: hypothetical protein B7Z80_17730 [Rhodospirillales bacterium 20-64-7]|nr:MAG: hypothetical protein B7Z80_17730 [Rhodospirillales bacterium 20-64-7]
MSVELQGDCIILAGRCRVEDAEALLGALQAGPGRTVDLSRCTALHTAVFQVLQAARPTLAGAPAEPGLRNWLMPALEARIGTFSLEPVRL